MFEPLPTHTAPIEGIVNQTVSFDNYKIIIHAQTC